MFNSMQVEMGNFISCEKGDVLGEVGNYLLRSVLGEMVGSLFNCE